MYNGVILIEEASSAIVVAELARTLGLEERLRILPHEGKSDLIDSFPRKITAWRSPQMTRFVICRDNDGANCKKLKTDLMDRVPLHARERVRIRLVVQELESWFLGDLQALAESKILTEPKIQSIQGKKKYRNPDLMTNAKQELFKLIENRGVRTLANTIAPHLNPTRNRSRSFQIFIETLKWAASPQ